MRLFQICVQQTKYSGNKRNSYTPLEYKSNKDSSGESYLAGRDACFDFLHAIVGVPGFIGKGIVVDLSILA
jgi:hypothetical protein